MKIKNKSLQTWAKLLPFLAPYKWQMILIIALMILGACFDMVQPLFSGYAVDNFIEPRTTPHSLYGRLPFHGRRADHYNHFNGNLRLKG